MRIDRPWAPFVALLCLAASPSDSAEVKDRLARHKTMFVGEATCAPTDRKACTKACTAAIFKPYRYDTAGAAACEVVGDIWMNGLADVKKPMPEVGLKSYSDACYVGQATACEKEAAYLEKTGDLEKALAVRVAACEKGYEPACGAAATMIDQHEMAYESGPYAVRFHVFACDEQKEAASCAWVAANPGPAEARRAELKAAREKEVATFTTESGSVKITAITDVVPLLDTHRLVWTTHPESQNPDTFELVGLVCYEVWIPTAASDDTALAATFADSLVRRKTAVDPQLIHKTKFTPYHPKSSCKDSVIRLAVN